MRKLMNRIVLLLAAAALLAPAGGAEAATRILLQGEFHGSEVQASSGEAWLALTESADGKFVVVPATLRVDAVEDPLLDEPGEASGKRVSAVGLEEVILLVRGNEHITAGPVSAAAIRMRGDGNALDADPELGWTITLGGQEYDLFTERVGTSDGHVRIRVLLRSSSGDQLLAGDRDSDLCANLIWAGDLDRDGSLDLLLDLSSGDNASIPTLFLSTAARPEQLLRAVARMLITGC